MSSLAIFLLTIQYTSVAEPHHVDAALVPGENLDAAPAPAPTLLFTKPTFRKQTKVGIMFRSIFSSDFFCFKFVIFNKKSKICYRTVWDIFDNLPKMNIMLRARVATPCGSGSVKMMRLLVPYNKR
jgi:hypothetical protein